MQIISSRAVFKADELETSRAPLGLIKTQRGPLGRQRLGQTPALKGAPIAFSKSLPSRLTKDLLLNEALYVGCFEWPLSSPVKCQDVSWHEPMRAQWDDVTQWFVVVLMLTDLDASEVEWRITAHTRLSLYLSFCHSVYRSVCLSNLSIMSICPFF